MPSMQTIAVTLIQDEKWLYLLAKKNVKMRNGFINLRKQNFEDENWLY